MRETRGLNSHCPRHPSIHRAPSLSQEVESLSLRSRRPTCGTLATETTGALTLLLLPLVADLPTSQYRHRPRRFILRSSTHGDGQSLLRPYSTKRAERHSRPLGPRCSRSRRLLHSQGVESSRHRRPTAHRTRLRRGASGRSREEEGVGPLGRTFRRRLACCRDCASTAADGTNTPWTMSGKSE